MDKLEFLDSLRRTYTRIGESKLVSDVSGVRTYDTLVFETSQGGAGWKNVSWYVLDEGDPQESAYPRRDPDAKTDLQKKVEGVVQAKEDAGEWWVAKIENIDEEERFADLRVSVATSKAAQIEEELMRVKELPDKPDQLVVSRVVDRARRKLIEKLFGTTDTVDTTV